MYRKTTNPQQALQRAGEISDRLAITYTGNGIWEVEVRGSGLGPSTMATWNALGFVADVARRAEPGLRQVIRWAGEPPVRMSKKGLKDGLPAHQMDAVAWLRID